MPRVVSEMQAQEVWFPLLLMFGEGAEAGTAAVRGEGDAQLLLASALPQLRALLQWIEVLVVLLLNLTAQLGSLSAAQMRKRTIVQGLYPYTPHTCFLTKRILYVMPYTFKGIITNMYMYGYIKR